MVKFQHKVEDYGAIIGIDLATYHTGLCVYNIKTQVFDELIAVNVKNSDDKRELSLFIQLKELFVKFVERYGRIFVIAERCPNQCGAKSTVQTLQSLYGSHSILHLAVDTTEGVELYDRDGIHTTSVKSLFKTKENPKPQKSDIRKKLVVMYHLEDSQLTDDISDAIAVVHTLLTKKWNADIDEKVKEIKREVKKLKTTNAIQERQLEMDKLNQMKI